LLEFAMTSRYADWVERAAFAASALCLVHCLALPLVLAALPVLSGILHLPEDIHRWVLLFAIPTSLTALVMGRQMGGPGYPIVMGLAGLGLLAVGAFVPSIETPATVAGSVTLAFAHILNWRLRHARHRHH
jgi:hypothetical protein